MGRRKKQVRLSDTTQARGTRRGPARKILEKRKGSNGKLYDILECGHAVPAYHKKTIGRYCLPCVNGPQWKIDLLGYVVSVVSAIAEGRRRSVVAELESRGQPIPDHLQNTYSDFWFEPVT